MMRFFVHQHHKSRIFANNSHVALSTPDDYRGREKEKDIEKLRSRYAQEAMQKKIIKRALFSVGMHFMRTAYAYMAMHSLEKRRECGGECLSIL